MHMTLTFDILKIDYFGVFFKYIDKQNYFLVEFAENVIYTKIIILFIYFYFWFHQEMKIIKKLNGKKTVLRNLNNFHKNSKM